MEHGAHQTATTRVAGEDQPFGGETFRDQVARYSEDVIHSRRKWKLRRQPVVSRKDSTSGYSRQVCQEQRVHAR